MWMLQCHQPVLCPAPSIESFPSRPSDFCWIHTYAIGTYASRSTQVARTRRNAEADAFERGAAGGRRGKHIPGPLAWVGGWGCKTGSSAGPTDRHQSHHECTILKNPLPPVTR
jgi:hypothetical protein